ncbi:MAG: hypothetical protein IJW55_08045 [Clostridia bacterium]|nr:hypothetical protein [Clostridia bacterium]
MKKKIRFGTRKENKEIVLDQPQNEYYENISARLGIFQVVLYLSLFAFVVLSFFRNTNLITYQNFYYFFKDLGASAETVDVIGSDAVTYPTANEQSFTLYRKGLAVAGNNSVTVFTATGRQTISQTINYQNPVALGSGKYLLVYELGGTQYSLYNSYTQIYAGKSDFPLYGATISEQGMYALISRSEEYTSVVSLYSSHFSLLNRYNKNGYVMDIAINEKGTRLALLTSSVKDGLFYTELTLQEPRTDASGITVPIGDTAALSCEFTSSGGISVLCNDRICFVSKTGELQNTYAFDGKILATADLGEEGATVCLRSSVISEKIHIIVFDKSGKMLYNESTAEPIEELSRFKDSLFLLTQNGITRLNIQNGSLTSIFCTTENRHILAIDENEVLLCSPQKAEYIHIEN